MLLRGKWTVACKCLSTLSSSGLWQASDTKNLGWLILIQYNQNEKFFKTDPPEPRFFIH